MPSHLLHVQEQLSPPLAFETFTGQSCPQLLWWNSEWALSPSVGAGLSLAQMECHGWQSGHGCYRQTQLGATSLPSHPGDGSQRPRGRLQSPGSPTPSVHLSVGDMWWRGELDVKECH